MRLNGAAKLAAQETPRQRLLDAATDLFCRYGVNAVGVDAIVAKAGTAKATLYKLFGSKERLVEEVLTAEGELWRTWFFARVTAAGASPEKRLAAVFPVLQEWFADKKFYGCPFINAVAEHDKANNRLRKLALSHKRHVLDFIETLCLEAGVADPERTTHEIALLMDGATVAAMVTKDPGVAKRAQSAVADLVKARSR